MKQCRYCNKPLVRKIRPNGSLEKLKDYSQRIVCNMACYRAYKRSQTKPPPPPPLPLEIWMDLTREVELPAHLERPYLLRMIRGAEWLLGQQLFDAEII